MHGRANQQLVISSAVPPSKPHHSDISWWLGLCWLTPSGYRSLSKTLMKQIWPLITLSAHSWPPLPSLFSLIMGETDLSSQNKGQCLFFCRPFTSGVFLRVRVLAPLMYNTPTFASAAPRTELSGPRQKRAERREDGRNTRERRSVFFPSQSTLYNWLF